MKSIDISAPRACGRADTANASIVSAKRIFLIIVKRFTRRSTFPPRDLFNLYFAKRFRPACAQRDISAITTDDADVTDLRNARALVCWFESLAVASRPLQRRSRRNRSEERRVGKECRAWWW